MICRYISPSIRAGILAPHELASGGLIVCTTGRGQCEIVSVGQHVGYDEGFVAYDIAERVPVVNFLSLLTGRQVHEKPVTFTRTPDRLRWVLKAHKTHKPGDLVMVQTRKGQSYPAILGQCIQSGFGVHIYEPALLGNVAEHLDAALAIRAKRAVETRRAALHVIPGGVAA